jgi:hypothetical protein
MRYVYPLMLGITLSLPSAYAAGSECDNTLTASLHQCERIVDSLHPEKAGQMRVFAFDGSEFTAGQVQWMRGQLNLVVKACDHGDTAEAGRRLADVQQLISEHHRAA